ncbi:MAG TPA: zinc-binding dehydrogenase, partial [Acidimicrobiales bacterium]
ILSFEEASGLMLTGTTAVHALTVIGTASERNHDDLRRMGAEPVAYGEGLLERITALAPEGVDAAFDTVGTDEALDVSVALVADRGRIATIAGFERGFELGIKVLGGAPGADPGVEIRDAARMELVRQAEAGTITVRVARTYPLAEAAEALRELSAGHAHGKIVLIP